jgi:hypothetical protein
VYNPSCTAMSMAVGGWGVSGDRQQHITAHPPHTASTARHAPAATRCREGVRQSGLSTHCAWGNAVVPAEPSCTGQLVSSWPLVLQFAIATAAWDWPHSLALVVAAEA